MSLLPRQTPWMLEAEQVAAWRRAAAKLIDGAIAAAALLALVPLAPSLGQVLYVVIFIPVGWVLLADWKGSVGKRVLRLKVVDARTGRPCGPWQSVTRNVWLNVGSFLRQGIPGLVGVPAAELATDYPVWNVLASSLSALVIVVEAWLVVARRSRQRVGDLLASTVVVPAAPAQAKLTR